MDQPSFAVSAKKVVALLLTLVVFAVACSGSDGAGDVARSTQADPASAPQPTATPVPAATPTAPPTTVPTIEPTPEPTPEPTSGDAGSPVQQQFDWVLQFLNAAESPSVDEVEEHFTAEFLAQVPAQVLIDTAPNLMPGFDAPFSVIETNDPVPDLVRVATIESVSGAQFTLTINVQNAEPHLIEGLLIAPAEQSELELEEYSNIESLDADLAQVASSHALGVYEVTNGACDAIATTEPTAPMPLGSGFKLWVLAELAHQIAAGDASWDEVLVVQDNLKSSPDGQVFGLAAGTELTLREHAELMISVSDNSATDHLLARLGRSNVQVALDRIGVRDLALNTPLLSTGELFQLKFIAAAPNADDYRSLDTAGRTALLEELQAATLPWVDDPTNVDLTNADGVAISQPRDLDLEWFGSPDDMCRTMVHLAELAEQPGLEPVAEILELNPGAGIPFDRELWDVIRFKGGSEPGVIAGNWWLERNDGRSYVLIAMANDEDSAIDEQEAVRLFASALSLIPE